MNNTEAPLQHSCRGARELAPACKLMLTRSISGERETGRGGSVTHIYVLLPCCVVAGTVWNIKQQTIVKFFIICPPHCRGTLNYSKTKTPIVTFHINEATAGERTRGIMASQAKLSGAVCSCSLANTGLDCCSKSKPQ